MMRGKMDSSCFSSERKATLGLSAILVILGHGLTYYASDSVMRYLGNIAGVAVLIFAFLSGMGCCSSLNHDASIARFYKRRARKVVTPYIIITVVFYSIFSLLITQKGIIDFILHVTTLSFWISHDGPWFFCMILIVYIWIPVLSGWYEKSSDFRTIKILLSIGFIMGVSVILEKNNQPLYSHLHLVIQTPIAFLLGYWIAFYVKNDRVSWGLVIIPTALCALAYAARRSLPGAIGDSIYEFLSIPFSFAAIYSVHWLRKLRHFYFCLSRVGEITLESYLFNTYLISLFNYTDSWTHSILSYLLFVALLGTILAFITKKLCLKMAGL